MANKKMHVQLDDIITTTNKLGLFSFGIPPKAKINNLTMKAPKILPVLPEIDVLHQERKSEIDILHQERKSANDEEFEDLSEKELLEYLTILQSLEKEEEELKIGILYEKFKKKEHISDHSLTLENINQLEEKLEQTKENMRMRQVYSSKKQLSENLHKIMQSHKNISISKAFEYSDEARIFIQNLVSEKKQKEKEIIQLQKQISENEKSCLQLRTHIDDCFSTSTKHEIESSAEEELKQLKEENDKRSSRIQLLSNIIKALIDNISIQGNLNDDLKLLALSCNNILYWNSEDLEEINELCKMIYSSKI